MPKKIKVGSVLLADYVAQGHAQKITIVNAYSGDILLSEMPAPLEFGIYVELHFGGAIPENVGFEVILDGKKIIGGSAGGAIGTGDPATIAIPHFPCIVMKDSFLDFYVTADGYVRTRALRKLIKKGVIP